MLLFEFDVVVSKSDFVGLEVNVLIGIADAIHLIADEFAQLCHVTGVGSKVE